MYMELRSLNQCYTSILLVERAKRAHSLVIVMTFEIFGIYSTYVYHSYCACVASSAIFENKLNGETGAACGRNQIGVSYSTIAIYTL